MTRRLAAGLMAAVCLGIGSAVPGKAEAAPVTFAFTGAVTQTMFDPNDPSGGEITFGTGFSGSYTFDSTAPDGISNGSSGSYASPAAAPYGFAVNFGPGHDFITSDALTVGVFDNAAGSDGYSVLACFGGFDCPNLTLELFLGDLDGSVFASDALPLDTLTFEAFEVATFALRGLIDGNQVEIRAESGSIVSDNTVLLSTGFGLRVGLGAIIRGNSVSLNETGLEVTCPSALIGNTFVNNSGGDIVELLPGCTRADNGGLLP